MLTIHKLDEYNDLTAVFSYFDVFEKYGYENVLSCPFFPAAAEVKPKTEAEGTSRL